MLDFAPGTEWKKPTSKFLQLSYWEKAFHRSAQAAWEWSLAYHSQTPSNPIDIMNRFETAFLWSFSIPINRLQISPYSFRLNQLAVR